MEIYISAHSSLMQKKLFNFSVDTSILYNYSKVAINVIPVHRYIFSTCSFDSVFGKKNFIKLKQNKSKVPLYQQPYTFYL